MKKIFLFAAGLLLGLNLMAQSPYGLTIGGVDVDDTNADDFYGDGTVWYDPSENALTLGNAHMTDNIWYHPTPWNEDSQFEIRILGKCVIDYDGGTSAGAIYAQVKHLYITGYGTEPAELVVRNVNNATFGQAIKVRGAGSEQILHLSGLKVKAESDATYAIECEELHIGTLTTLEAVGADDKSALSNPVDPTKLTEAKLVYSTKNSSTLAEGHRIIIVPEMLVKEAEYEGLKIQGRKINNYTVNDVFEDESGSTWDAKKGILTVKGDNYSNLEDAPFLDFSREATIKCEGGSYKVMDNTSSYPLIYTNSNLTISSGPELLMGSVGMSVIDLDPIASNILLTFDKANLGYFAASSYSIRGTGTTYKANIAFKDSHIDDMMNVSGINNATLTGCRFDATGIELDGGRFVDASDPMACEYGCPEPTTIRINTDPYPVAVANMDVFPYNANDVLGDGMVSYDPATLTLTIQENANISTGAMGAVIKVVDQDLTVVFVGAPAQFYGESEECIVMDATDKKLTLISQPGKYNAQIELLSDNNMDLPVINALGCDVEFRGVNPFIVASAYYYLTAPVIKAKNVYINTPVSFENKKTSSLYNALNVAAVELGAGIVLDPSLDKLQYNTTSKQVEWKVASTDKILWVNFIGGALKNNAEVYINGIRVTQVNKTDILGDGKISYDEDNQKLTLDNAKIYAYSGDAIYASSTGLTTLTIELKGNNVITCDDAYGIETDVNTDIIGVGVDPSLRINLEAYHNGYIAIHTNAEQLSLKNVTVLAKINQAANSAVSVGTTIGVLTVDNSDLRAILEDPAFVMNAISCTDLKLKNGSVLRYDEPTWPMVSWNESINNFEGSDLSRIWIGKNADFPLSVENTFAPVEKATKIMLNGQIFILRGEHMYNMQGMMIR